jgi:asparagine synthase (glutamine-hydrolysing)
MVAERCGTQHTEIALTGDAIPARLDEALAALDQPTMDGINTYFVSWAAREVGLKVALSGLGGDELFAGYSTFADTPRLAQLATAAKFVPSALRGTTSGMLRSLLASGRSTDAATKATAAWRNPDRLPHPYYFARSLFPPGEIEKLIEPRFRPSTLAADGYTLEPTWLGWLQLAADEARHMDPIAAVSWLELRTYMASTLLRDTDSVSMARSLEVRVPLLDTPLVEFVSALPDEARRKSGVQKALLVEALGDTLPWEEWLRGPLKSRLEKSFAAIAPPLASVLKTEGIQSVWKSFLAGKTSWSRPWSLFVLNEWARREGFSK